MLRVIGVGLAALALASFPAKADLILVQNVGGVTSPAPSIAASFTDLGADGFGHDPRLLTMQTSTVETGSVTPVDLPQGDAVPNAGGNKSNTPTLSALGWTSGSQVGIGFNSDQTGQTGITMQSLVLTIYNGTTALASFPLLPSLAPLQFTAADLALQQGNGNAVFNFGLNAAEQTQFNTLLAMSGSSGFFAGLASQLGCPAGSPVSCMPSNDGPDSFIGFAQAAAVPGPIVGAGVPGLVTATLGLVALARRRRKRSVVA